ncbi:hypothetical protein LTR62_006848 [Meristemomyces frigidus]|uniref:Uncharacterized protein n=1 Tax=Meristemomyces frigidus TaxID=1508187 RepID=A0AAN7YIA8_9PEZI|nr:hypothetical protein LTR62_006848 [Meristemomyces frigidus]
MTSWLAKQRKQALLDLSREAGLQQDPSGFKDDMVSILDTFLQQNATRLHNHPTFERYYGVQRRTPYGQRSSSTVPAIPLNDDDFEVKSVVKGRGRRTTRVKEELDGADDHEPQPALSSPTNHASTSRLPTSRLTTTRTSDALPTLALQPSSSDLLPRRTPGRPRGETDNPRLPASPADVADLAEYQTSQVYAGINDIYTLSGIPETLTLLRETCSTLTGIQTTIQLLEALSLLRALLPWTYLTEISGVRARGLSTSLYYPDLFVLLTSGFWAPTLLYTATALAIPSLFAYFFNLTLRDVRRHGAVVAVPRYALDPLTFNLVKALLTYVVYSRGVGAQTIGGDNILTVDRAMVGGYQGILVGSYVMILMSLYEAALRKP